MLGIVVDCFDGSDDGAFDSCLNFDDAQIKYLLKDSRCLESLYSMIIEASCLTLVLSVRMVSILVT